MGVDDSKPGGIFKRGCLDPSDYYDMESGMGKTDGSWWKILVG